MKEKPMKLFRIYSESKRYPFIYARNIEEARAFFQENLDAPIKKIEEVTRKTIIHSTLYMERIKGKSELRIWSERKEENE
jgi:hypothetical protein